MNQSKAGHGPRRKCLRRNLLAKRKDQVCLTGNLGGNKIIVTCSKKAAIGFGSKGKTTTGLKN